MEFYRNKGDLYCLTMIHEDGAYTHHFMPVPLLHGTKLVCLSGGMKDFLVKTRGNVIIYYDNNEICSESDLFLEIVNMMGLSE